MEGLRILVIPDTQCKPGVDIEHMYWAGLYAAKMRPDVIIHIGDHWDMPSLSSYDKGKKSFEGRRVLEDIEFGNRALDLFERGIATANKGRTYKLWHPRKIFLMGNHENRIDRAIESSAELEGLISTDDFNLQAHGWEIYPFLKVVVVGGVAFSHFFTSGVMGRPVSSARTMLTKKAMSCVMGHIQSRDIAYGARADGTTMTGIHVGTFYQHDEDYLGPQGNSQWRGLWVLHDVQDGAFDEMPVSMDFLKRRYGGK